MTWPLVFRATRQAELDIAARIATAAQADAAFWKQRAQHAETEANAATLREVSAGVRAREWEAIAMKLIAKGAGRPRADVEATPASAIAKRIREESDGDPALSAHFWKVAREAKAAGKSDEEIVGLIGWETGDPPTA